MTAPMPLKPPETSSEAISRRRSNPTMGEVQKRAVDLLAAQNILLENLVDYPQT